MHFVFFSFLKLETTNGTKYRMIQVVEFFYIICFIMFDFIDKWRFRLRVCVYYGNFTGEWFAISKRLTSKRVWNKAILLLFLFLLVVEEGFSGMFSRAIELNLYYNFSVGSSVLVSSIFRIKWHLDLGLSLCREHMGY